MITYRLRARERQEVSIDTNRAARAIFLSVTNTEGRTIMVEVEPGEAVAIGTSLVSVGRGMRR